MRFFFMLMLFLSFAAVATAEASTDVYRLITAAAKRHGISPAIALKVAKIESAFDCGALGRAGELGPFQIKPATARLIGYEGSASELRSCRAGLEWGVRHLAMAIRSGGVWKHNQGLWAKSKSRQAAMYEKKVMMAKIAGMGAIFATTAITFRGGRPSP